MIGVHWGEKKKIHDHTVQRLSLPVNEGALQGWSNHGKKWEVYSPPPDPPPVFHSLIAREG